MKKILFVVLFITLLSGCSIKDNITKQEDVVEVMVGRSIDTGEIVIEPEINIDNEGLFREMILSLIDSENLDLHTQTTICFNEETNAYDIVCGREKYYAIFEGTKYEIQFIIEDMETE